MHTLPAQPAPIRPKAACAVILIAGGLMGTALLCSAEPAAAQQGFGNFFGYQTQQRTKRRSARRTRRSHGAEASKETKEAKKQTQEKAAPSGPVYAVISIGDQRISVYDSTGRIAQSRVSTGMRGFPTPQGVFSVIQRNRYHHSNIYSGAPMPWMQRITWSGVAMHAGVVPGYPASHGCIRLPYSFAPQMWGLTKMGSRVIVARRDTVPVDIAHPFLPLPKMQPAPPAPPAQAAALAPETPQAPIELASIGAAPGDTGTTAAVSGETAAGQARTLDPIAYAAALKEKAAADKAAADEAAKLALEAAQAAGAEARQAVDDLRQAEADFKAAEQRLAELEAQPAAVEQSPSGKDPAADAAAAEAARVARDTALTAARSEFARARAALDEARTREAARTPAAFAAVDAWKAAVAASDAAAKTLAEAERRTEPVTVLISKKEGRIFMRQKWQEVYEAPVVIRDPERPLGTHVYIAVAAEPDGSAVRWSAITVPEGAPGESSRRRARDQDEPAESTLPPDTAAGALDRIELPTGARERISELLWAGATLIVSDHGRSPEMGEYTDIIVSTR